MNKSSSFCAEYEGYIDSFNKLIKTPTLTFRTYLIDPKCVSSGDTLRKIARESEVFHMKNLQDNTVCNYIYDSENDLFHLSTGFSDIHVLTTFEFFENLQNFQNYYVFVRTKEKLPFKFVRKTKVVNWSKIVTDLEKIGFVVTFPTQSYLCVDTRKFYFIDENIEEARDVDFLGTTFATDISTRVVDLWQRAKGLKVLSKSL